MIQGLNDAYKIGITAVILCFIISIGLTIMTVGKHFMDEEIHSVEEAIGVTELVDAYCLASYGKPAPVAAMWRVMNKLDPLGNTGESVIKSFKLQYRNPSDGALTTVTTNKGKITNFLMYKGYFGYKEDSGKFTVTVIITNAGSLAELQSRL